MPSIVRFKHLDRLHPTEPRKVVELAYGKFNVPFTRIFNTNEGFKVICRSEQDADKILSKDAQVELEKIGLQVIVPPETKARRSILLRQLDQLIGQNSPEDIKDEIERENDWIKIEEVVKMKNYTHILKLRLEETIMVEKAKRQGILAYNMSISPSQIEVENYVHIRSCYKCYKMEDHLTKDCPHTDLKICSECAETGHTYKDCRNTEKACINCKNRGNPASHRTLAMSCPLRKAIVSDKLKEQKTSDLNKDENTYAAIARRAVAEVRQAETTTQINLSEYKHTKILISIMHAHVMNLCNPGSYHKELNKMLEKNELPTMWFPENPDSGKLLGATMDQTQQDNMDTDSSKTYNTAEDPVNTEMVVEQHKTKDHVNRDPRLEHRSRNQDSGTIPKTKSISQSRNRNTSDRTETTYPESAQEIGLKIHLTGKTIVPTMDPHAEFVLEQIQSGAYKWTYTDSRYDEDIIRQLLAMKMIKISKHDFKRTDEGSYRKIRNGLNIRSPLQETRKSKKQS